MNWIIRDRDKAHCHFSNSCTNLNQTIIVCLLSLKHRTFKRRSSHQSKLDSAL